MNATLYRKGKLWILIHRQKNDFEKKRPFTVHTKLKLLF